jgi:metal transporter CNNM
MGLMSLDPLQLKVLLQSGTEAERRHAANVLPIVQQHHFVLVTLLLFDTTASEALPLFLDRLAGLRFFSSSLVAAFQPFISPQDRFLV